MKLSKKINQKMIQNKTNNNQKDENQIWNKNKLKSDVDGWSWKQNSIKKMIKKIAIKRMRTKFIIKIKWNQMTRKEIEKK